MIQEIRMETNGMDMPDGKMALLKNYLSATDLSDAFWRLAEEDEEHEIFLDADWRGAEEDIVQDAEKILQTGCLHATLNETDDEIGYEIVITYRGNSSTVPSLKEEDCRDATITTLNEILAPEYELRFCVHSDGGDTVSLLPLSAGQWRELENAFGRDRVDACFRTIRKGSKLFGEPKTAGEEKKKPSRKLFWLIFALVLYWIFTNR